MIFNDLVSSVGNTPVIKIKNIAPANVNLFVNAEYFNPGGSVKDRLALNIIDKAEKNKTCLKRCTCKSKSSVDKTVGYCIINYA